MPVVTHPDLLVGNETGDDAAVYRLDEKTSLIVTVDFFTPITDDPYEFGAVAAANSLSDVYAMGGRPLVALNVVGFPINLVDEMLADVLKGGYDKAAEAGCLIVGGHTVDDAEPKYGLSVVGLVETGKHVTNAGARPGDALVLTKPIGTGIIATGCKAGTTPPEVLKTAVDAMATLNRGAAEAMMKVGVNSCTDIPVFPGARELLAEGVVPGGTYRNMAGVDESTDWDESLTQEDRLLLCDAQTSGGLLISVSPERLEFLVAELKKADALATSVVGEIIDGPVGHIRVSA